MWVYLVMISLLAGFLYFIGMRIKPDAKAFMLLERCLVGGAVLYVFNFLGAFFGMSVGINPISSLITGLLGAPGLVLMVVIRMMG